MRPAKEKSKSDFSDIFTTDINVINDVEEWYGVGMGSGDSHLFWKLPDELCYVYSYFNINDSSITNTYINPTDETYFDNYSFTLSYSLDYECWAFFHDYIPDYLFRLRNNILLSFSSNNAISNASNNPKAGYSKLYLHNSPEKIGRAHV